jgi:hypothetical protein
MIVMDSVNKYIDIKNYDVTYTMFSVPVPDDPDMSSRNQNKAFLKVNYFVKSILDGSIVYTPDDLHDVNEVFLNYDNNYVVLPDTTDTTLLEALHSKMNVLCGDHTYIDDLSLTDTDVGVGYNMTADSEEITYGLPEQSDWLPEFSFWPVSWWERYDITTFDNYSETEQDVETFQNTDVYLNTLTSDLDQIDQQVDDLFNQMMGKTGEVIELDQIRAQQETKKVWKPTLV